MRRDAPLPRSECGGPTGYLHPAYAASLAEFGRPVPLSGSGGWLLERVVPGTDRFDAMASYPFLVCRDWTALADDLGRVPGEWLSVVAVTDPFIDLGVSDLRSAFRDLVRPFKDHFVVEFATAPDRFVSTHHTRNARRALQRLRVERDPNPPRLLERWEELYDALRHRHDLSGLTAFSRRAFERQLRVPGVEAFVARERDRIVGITLWYVQGETAYYHLGAYDEVGYDAGASFALFWSALHEFAEGGLQRLGLGAGPGAADDRTAGLTRFKRGWSTGTRTVYLCGRIVDPEAYARMAGDAHPPAGHYFPPYRRGEFA